MQADVIPDLVPPPATSAERWLHCFGLKALLNASLRFHLRFAGGPAPARPLAYRAAVELLDPCTFLAGWAHLAVHLRHRPRCGGLAPAGLPPRPPNLPLILPLFARACETGSGDLAAQWFVLPAPSLSVEVRPAAGLALPAAGVAHVLLTFPAVGRAAAAALAAAGDRRSRCAPRHGPAAAIEGTAR